MTRLEGNREILKILSEQVENNPDMRFIQLLVNLEMIKSPGNWNEEPDSTLAFIKGSVLYNLPPVSPRSYKA
jgi:hypothetical protein